MPAVKYFSTLFLLISLCISHAAAATEIVRIGTLENSTLWIKDTRDSQWIHQHNSIKGFALDGTRVGVLTTDGVLLVKDGSLSADWVHQHNSVKDFALDGTRVGVLTTDGVLLVKDGSLSADWVHEENNIKNFRIANKVIIIQNENNVVRYKKGVLNADWNSDERHDVDNFSIFVRGFQPYTPEAGCPQTYCVGFFEACCTDGRFLGTCFGIWSCSPLEQREPL